MGARLASCLLALVVLATGVMPAVGGYRCVVSGARMQAMAACCHHDDATPAWKARCCEPTAAPRVEPRRPPSATDQTLAPPTVAAILAFVPLAPGDSSAVVAAARARGRPPGERLHRFTAVLRV